MYHKATTEENKKHLRGGNDMTGVLIGLGVYVVVMMFAPCVYYGITGWEKKERLTDMIRGEKDMLTFLVWWWRLLRACR